MSTVTERVRKIVVEQLGVKEEDLNNYRNSELFKTIWPTIKPWFEVKAEAWSMQLVTN